MCNLRGSILILGASRYQLPAIVTAKRLGYQVIVLDNLPSNPGHDHADRSYIISTIDIAAVVEVARREKIIGVMAPATDVAVPTCAEVAHDLTLPGPPPSAASVCCDKAAFRRFLSERGFPSPRVLFEGGFLGRDHTQELHFTTPVIVKPARSSGSKGVRIVLQREDLVAAIEEAADWDLSGRVIIEEYLSGRQGTVEGFLRDGALSFALITDRFTASAPWVGTIGHHVPSRLPRLIVSRVLEQITELCRILGVGDGPIDCDFVATESEVYLLELALRLGGNSICSLVQGATGVDLTACAVAYACGEQVTPRLSNGVLPSAIRILGVPESGYLDYNEPVIHELLAAGDLKRIEFDVPRGTWVRAFHNGRDRCGEAFFQAATRDELDRSVASCLNRLMLKGVKQWVSQT